MIKYPKMWKSRVKPSANPRANSVYFSVQILPLVFFSHFKITFKHLFSPLSHHLLNSPPFSDAIKTFPLLHNSYYYYYEIYKYNN